MRLTGDGDVLVTEVRVAAHGVNTRVSFIPGGGGAHKRPVARDELVIAQAKALLLGHLAARLGDGGIAEAVRVAGGVGATLAVALQGWKKAHTRQTHRHTRRIVVIIRASLGEKNNTFTIMLT